MSNQDHVANPMSIGLAKYFFKPICVRLNTDKAIGNSKAAVKSSLVAHIQNAQILLGAACSTLCSTVMVSGSRI